MESNQIFRQLFDEETWTYTYLIADAMTKEGLLIDPVDEKIERDLKFIDELGIKLKYTIETHTHADHTTSASKISEATGAKKVVGKKSGVECADIFLDDGDVLNFGNFNIIALSTPGHTSGCTSYIIGNKVFTGDALLIRGTGRTDFQQGSAATLYDSVYNKLFTLPDLTYVYPSHDYKGATVSTILEEKRFNPRLNVGTTKEEFIETMSKLKLAYPKKIQEAVPANLKCGQKDLSNAQ